MASGLMLVVEASCLFEVVAAGRAIGERMLADTEQNATHIIDAEVTGLSVHNWRGLMNSPLAFENGHHSDKLTGVSMWIAAASPR